MCGFMDGLKAAKLHNDNPHPHHQHQQRPQTSKGRAAYQKCSKAISLYDEAWTSVASKNHHGYYTTHPKFARAHSKLEKASKLDPDNPTILKNLGLAQCKICGDESYKKGLTCQRQATEAFNSQNFEFAYSRYSDAMDDYMSALHHFAEGMTMREDTRFEKSVRMTRDQIQICLAERGRVRPFKEAVEKKREAERPLRRQILEEKEKRKLWEEAGKEIRKRQMSRGILNAGLTVGSLALMTRGGPGSSTNKSQFGLTSHHHHGNHYGLLF